MLDAPNKRKITGSEIKAVIAAREEYFVKNAVRIQIIIKITAGRGL